MSTYNNGITVIDDEPSIKDSYKKMDGIPWPKLLKGVLIKRYKRFMADVKLQNGHVVTAHCPNSGSMKGCSEPGRPVYISRSTNPKRKLKYTWEMIDMATSLVGVNTLVPNRLVRASIQAGLIPTLTQFDTIRTEVNYGNRSRIDILLEKGLKKCFVEVKNCTLVMDSTACFPDAVTTRGHKHLVELQKQVQAGHRAVSFFLVQRMDAKRFRPADHIDLAYGQELRKAVKNGVEVIVCDVAITLEDISLNKELPCLL